MKEEEKEEILVMLVWVEVIDCQEIDLDLFSGV